MQRNRARLGRGALAPSPALPSRSAQRVLRLPVGARGCQSGRRAQGFGCHAEERQARLCCGRGRRAAAAPQVSPGVWGRVLPPPPAWPRPGGGWAKRSWVGGASPAVVRGLRRRLRGSPLPAAPWPMAALRGPEPVLYAFVRLPQVVGLGRALRKEKGRRRAGGWPCTADGGQGEDV